MTYSHYMLDTYSHRWYHAYLSSNAVFCIDDIGAKLNRKGEKYSAGKGSQSRNAHGNWNIGQEKKNK